MFRFPYDIPPSLFNDFKPKAQDSPDKTIHINGGNLFFNNVYLRYDGGNTQELPFSLEINKYLLIGLDKYGQIKYYNEQILPTIPIDFFPICYIYIKTNDLFISDDMIIDIRTYNRFGNPPIRHNEILENNKINSHNINSITGLQSSLDKKIGKEDYDYDKIELDSRKTDHDGTISNIWKIQKTLTGNTDIPAGIEVEQGSSQNVFIKYYPIEKKWKYTEDGSTIKTFDTSNNDALQDEINDIKGKIDSIEYTILNINTTIETQAEEINNININLNDLLSQLQNININNETLNSLNSIVNDIQNSIEILNNAILNN